MSTTQPGDEKRLTVGGAFSFFLVLSAWLTLLIAAPYGLPGQNAGAAQAEPEILSKAKAYCRLLQTASLDFVCREKITERMRGLSTNKGWLDLDPLHFEVKDMKYEHELLYEYQFVRSGTIAKETRNLLEEDGRAKDEKNCTLQTRFFHFQNVLFGPAALLDERNSDKYDFELREEAPEAAEQAVILAAVPKKAAEAEHLPFGKIWVSPQDGSILKIEWDERTIAGYSVLEERAKELKAKPSLRMRTEFGFSKGGLRFPSRHTIVEAYVKEKGPPFIRSEMIVEYGHYQFFTVETQVQFKKGP